MSVFQSQSAGFSCSSRQEGGFSSSSSSSHGIQPHCRQSRRANTTVSSLTINFNPLRFTHRKHDENPILKLQPAAIWKKTPDQFRRIVMKAADSGFNLQPQKSSDDDDDGKNEMSRMEFLHSEDHECHDLKKNKMGFTVREAFLDEEFWSAAWLRAESFLTDDRFLIHYKKIYREREFDTIKRQSNPLNSPKSFCIIAVKKEERNVKLTTLESIVGTLDLSVHQLLQGQTYPEEPPKPCSTISNPRPEMYGLLNMVCVAKSARRQGIATKMLHFAIETAKSQGLKKVFLYVDRINKPAWELYQRMGFRIVESAVVDYEEDPVFLLQFTV